MIEFSACMFFARMASYTFPFWYPMFHEQNNNTAGTTAYFSMSFELGGVIGAMATGFLKDVSGKGALVCVSFLAVAIPVLAMIYREEYVSMGWIRHWTVVCIAIDYAPK